MTDQAQLLNAAISLTASQRRVIMTHNAVMAAMDALADAQQADKLAGALLDKAIDRWVEMAEVVAE
tara:strand:- start:142 stop:339 length:198 start_codon:yes stop_codon:yes gene_type:complete